MDNIGQYSSSYGEVTMYNILIQLIIVISYNVKWIIWEIYYWNYESSMIYEVIIDVAMSSIL